MQLWILSAGTVSGNLAGKIFDEMVATGVRADDIIARRGHRPVTEAAAGEKAMPEVPEVNSRPAVWLNRT